MIPAVDLVIFILLINWIVTLVAVLSVVVIYAIGYKNYGWNGIVLLTDNSYIKKLSFTIMITTVTSLFMVSVTSYILQNS